MSTDGENEFKKIFPKRWSSLDSPTHTLVNSPPLSGVVGFSPEVGTEAGDFAYEQRGGTNGCEKEGQEKQGKEKGSGEEEGIEEEVVTQSLSCERNS